MRGTGLPTETFPSPWNDGNQWMSWALFDGHAGWQTADLLKKQLLPFLRHSLSHAKSAAGEESVSNEVVQHAIMKGFVNLDDSLPLRAQNRCKIR